MAARRVVRHRHDPVRAIQTGIGPVEVQKPKARDRAAASGERIRFTSNILPKWARRTKSLDALLPVLYLRGISAGDFQEALAALLGKDAPNLSAAVIARLKSEWEDEYRRWQKRDLSVRHYVYVWADGVYLQARMEPQAECMLVLSLAILLVGNPCRRLSLQPVWTPHQVSSNMTGGTLSGPQARPQRRRNR
jgi:putative transposase